MMKAARIACVVAGFGVLVLPTGVSAQSSLTATIAGSVRDSSGAVMPGVTVEAASPALIEKVRAVVTDDQGLYRIVDLRPGAYTVTFTLAGFSPFIRSGIELTTAFTATVNAELRVGSIEESITVSGAAPIVDTQNVIARSVFQDKVLDAMPVGRNTGMYATLIPAAKIAIGGGATGGLDVGGTQSERSTTVFSVHGGTGDLNLASDGMQFVRGGGGGCATCSINRVSAQEVTVQTGGITAENERGGVQLNIVPKEGGNSFSGSFVTEGSAGALQSDNVGDDMRARGVVGSPTVKRLYDVGGGFGGPIRQDKLWFFTALRKWETQQWLPGKYYNQTQGTPFYTADPSRPAHSIDHYLSSNLRLTWQASQKLKINAAYEYQDNCNCLIRLIAENRAPEATGDHFYPSHFPQATFSFPATNRLLIEGGAALFWSPQFNKLIRGVRPSDISIREASTGFISNARADNTGATGAYGFNYSNQSNERFAVSYVTGTHNLKVGLYLMQMWSKSLFEINGAQTYVLRNGLPIQVAQWATPDGRRDGALNTGLYVQDQWTVRSRLTLNLGLRFDQYRGWAAEQNLPAGPFVGARHFAATDDLVKLQDLAPRIGAAYDLFGNGKTALKGFVGRYVVGRGGGQGNANPAAQIVLSATRTWADANGDYIPQSSELGALSNTQFGNPAVSNLTVDRDVSFGFGNRDYTWQGSVSVQHEIRPGLGLDVGYFRTSYGNLSLTDNVLVTNADFDQYCITAPVDARLPGGGGNQVCGLYDVKQAKFGQVQNAQGLAGDRRTQVFNGVDVTMNARFGGGGLVAGGLATGNTVMDDCDAAIDNPGAGLVGVAAFGYCRTTLSWSDDIQIKMFGAYPLPWDLQASATFQNLPGLPVIATWAVPGTEMARGLGRTPSAGINTTAPVALIEPNTMFEDRMTLLSLRFTKLVRIGRVRVTGNFDVHNVFNASSPQSTNTTYGPTWLNVLNILSGRLLKFGANVEF